MPRLGIEQAQINLPTLVRTLEPAEEMEIVENEQVVAPAGWSRCVCRIARA